MLSRKEVPRWFFWPALMIVNIIGLVWLLPKALLMDGLKGFLRMWEEIQSGNKAELEGRDRRIKEGW